ncbi:DNA repair protein RecN [Cellulomonas sp. APG4]|uniref:DNA repair protein RecN n=1 Tax=Cellulomonas sp. APG4 TaxID=1538656 RepID=UPI00137A30B3|nr:DNA repair protein RecN [Cellulomonas sp. APG4]
MIEDIRIENLGVITSAHVPLGPGLTVITGETGAGKTMVLTGLGLILGGRADAGAVRAGATQASAEGCFVLPHGSPVAARALEAGATVDDDGSLVVARTVAAAGRSRAVLGGRTVPQGLLAELADQLVTVHGQAEQNRLRSPQRQREALDAFAGPDLDEALSAYRRAWAERRQLAAELDEILTHDAERRHEAELLRVGLAEVERVDPQPGEDHELAAEAQRLDHAEALRTAARSAHDALGGGGDLGDVGGAAVCVDDARRALEQVSEHDDQLAQLATRVAEVGYLVADLVTELAGYGEDLQADPARLDVVHRRRAELTALARTHAGTVDDVLAWAEGAGRRLLELDGGETRTEEIRERLADLETELLACAARVTQVRRSAADVLARAVTDELTGLAMSSARLVVELETLDEPGPWGAEEVRMNLEPHAGAPARPLGQGASGGELSRVMLAIEVALATAPGSGAARPDTFVFDEVDAGVGGKAAVEVGRRLAELSKQAQVVVVTHLAQVAAFADQHLVVSKSVESGADVVTASDVRRVDGDDRVAELARMLSGQEDSSTAREHAAELLERSVVGR